MQILAPCLRCIKAARQSAIATLTAEGASEEKIEEHLASLKLAFSVVEGAHLNESQLALHKVQVLGKCSVCHGNVSAFLPAEDMFVKLSPEDRLAAYGKSYAEGFPENAAPMMHDCPVCTGVLSAKRRDAVQAFQHQHPEVFAPVSETN